MKYTTRPVATELDEAVTHLQQRSGPGVFSFAVTLLSDTAADNASNGANEEQLKNKDQRNGKVIGLMGCAHELGTLGYKFNSDYGKQGYATEALLAFLPKLFEIMPSSLSMSESAEDIVNGQPPMDYIQAHVDVENQPSMKLLERAGFSRGEVTKGAYTSGTLGLRDAVTYRLPRPGMRLEDVVDSLKKTEEAGPPVPDLM
ncbi:hypothetical protein AAFC00_001017 [Neodothiora populina]